MESLSFQVWFYLLRPFLYAAPVQVLEAKLSPDALLQMTGAQVRDTMRRLGSSSEECAKLIAALSCLKSATESGMGNISTRLHVYMYRLVFSLGFGLAVFLFPVVQEVN